MDRVITEIWWEKSQGFDARAATVFSDSSKIRLDPEDHKIKLTLQESNWRYPTDTDLSVRSRTYNPEAVQQLLMLQLNSTIPVDEDGVALATVKMRIYNGTNEMWWTGAAWAIAAAGEWNTEAEINANISTFDVTSRKFAIVLNLQTLDDKVTPDVESVFILWQGEIDWSQDIILNSLTKTVQEEASYFDDAALPPLPADSTTIDLDDYVDESNLNIIDVEAVYENVSDPYHLTNLLSSYNSSTKVITLNSTMLSGGVAYIRLKVLASVAWDTQQDFTEVGNLPQVILSNTRTINSSPYSFIHSSSIVRRDTNAAVKTPAPYRMTYQVTMEVRCDRSRGQQRLLDSLITLLTDGPSSEEGPFLKSRATDRRYRLWLQSEFIAVSPETNLSDIRIFQAEFNIQDVALNLSAAVDTFAVQTLKMGFSAIQSEAEQKAIINNEPIPKTTQEVIEVE
jgi:hypothetical protein